MSEADARLSPVLL